MFECYFVEIGILAYTKVYLQIGTKVFDVKWYDCPKNFMCNKKMFPFMKVLGKKFNSCFEFGSKMYYAYLSMPSLLSSKCVHDPIDHKMLKKVFFVQTVT